MNKEIEQYRPEWVEPEFLKKLGFELISDKDGYLKYQNDGKIFKDKYYNKDFPLPKGKRLVFINCTYHPEDEIVFVGIREDGDTRTVYNGICGSPQFFVDVISNVR